MLLLWILLQNTAEKREYLKVCGRKVVGCETIMNSPPGIQSYMNIQQISAPYRHELYNIASFQPSLETSCYTRCRNHQDAIARNYNVILRKFAI